MYSLPSSHPRTRVISRVPTSRFLFLTFFIFRFRSWSTISVERTVQRTLSDWVRSQLIRNYLTKQAYFNDGQLEMSNVQLAPLIWASNRALYEISQHFSYIITANFVFRRITRRKSKFKILIKKERENCVAMTYYVLYLLLF